MHGWDSQTSWNGLCQARETTHVDSDREIVALNKPDADRKLSWAMASGD
jgi:hypothetical protein